MEVKKIYIDLILKYADDYKPSTYNTKYSNIYYLERLQIKNQRFFDNEHIFAVLGDVVTWKLTKLCFVN